MFVNSEDCTCIRTFCKEIGIPEKTAVALLLDHRYLYRSPSGWQRSARSSTIFAAWKNPSPRVAWSMCWTSPDCLFSYNYHTTRNTDGKPERAQGKLGIYFLHIKWFNNDKVSCINEIYIENYGFLFSLRNEIAKILYELGLYKNPFVKKQDFWRA